MTYTPVEAAITESDSAGYFREKWGAFKQLEPRIHDLQHRAALSAQHYREAGNTAQEMAAKALIYTLRDLSILHGRIVAHFSDLAPYVGLGAIAVPVAVAAAFSTAALVLLWFFRKFDLQEKALEMLEAGTLTEAGFKAMNESLGASPLRETAGILKLAMWAFLGWMAFQAIQGAGAFRRNPPLVIFGNPPGTFGREVVAIQYQHEDDGELYEHEFDGGVEMEALEGGDVLISHPTKRIWREFF